MDVSIVWFRQDLRVEDNEALLAGTLHGAVLPLFVWAPEEEFPWEPGAASRWWLHQSLAALDERLRGIGSRLVVRRGPSFETILNVARSIGAKAIYWNRRYEPAVIARDAALKEKFRAEGLRAESFNAALLLEPWQVKNGSGKPFQVFTPFWKRCLEQLVPPPPRPAPLRLAPLGGESNSSKRGNGKNWPESVPLSELGLEPKIDWAAGFRAVWRPGEAGAAAHLERFLTRAYAGYASDRDRPDHAGTSRLSPHLHFGEISPRQVWHAVRAHAERQGDSGWRAGRFVAELGWREFAHHLLYHFPQTPSQPLRPEFTAFPWRSDPEHARAWREGKVGYPIVDAGLRELWATGWMHNRVRMIAGSFLVKDLLLSWHEGARWFWDTLVDADLAQNTLGWQWVSGCGADAAPYFRVFNPELQGQKFDPDGSYVRRWCPELGRLPDKFLHAPWKAAPEVLARAGIQLGRDYPLPIVSHAIARQVALEAYEKCRKQARA